MHLPDNYYEYSGGVIVCGECLDSDLAETKKGNLVGDERVYPGMFKRMKDDQIEPYMCDICQKMNVPYELLGDEV